MKKLLMAATAALFATTALAQSAVSAQTPAPLQEQPSAHTLPTRDTHGRFVRATHRKRHHHAQKKVAAQ